jgi:hypothetical protein
MDGTGNVGTQALRRWSVGRLQPAEAAELRSASGLEVLELAIEPVENPSLLK